MEATRKKISDKARRTIQDYDNTIAMLQQRRQSFIDGLFDGAEVDTKEYLLELSTGEFIEKPKEEEKKQ